jgi:aspartyl/asparaginyl-tRNA synthetase
MVRKLRNFFQEQKGFIEVPAQSRLSILAACEQPETITDYKLGGMVYPLPQTGQMWLEYEMLRNPHWPGVFTITTSYRDEPNPIEGRHLRIFPMFEFESHGTIVQLKKLELELLQFLGFQEPISVDYTATARKYNTHEIEHVHETRMEKELGSSLLLERFPEYTHPFWNMKYSGNGLYNKIDVILCGQETIGSAERESNIERMRQRFFSIKDGSYAALLINRFGENRILAELDAYLKLPMIERFGGGIGLTRLERAMSLSGLLGPQTDYFNTVGRQSGASAFL